MEVKQSVKQQRILKKPFFVQRKKAMRKENAEMVGFVFVVTNWDETKRVIVRPWILWATTTTKWFYKRQCFLDHFLIKIIK